MAYEQRTPALRQLQARKHSSCVAVCVKAAAWSFGKRRAPLYDQQRGCAVHRPLLLMKADKRTFNTAVPQGTYFTAVVSSYAAPFFCLQSRITAAERPNLLQYAGTS